VVNVVKTTSQDREQELVLARANAIVNQLYVLSVNCAAPAGRGRSIAVDPEGWVLGEAGLGEDTLIVHYEPERVARVRRTGTSGTNRLWEQFSPDDEPIPLPMYGGRIDPARWAPGSPPTS
jgi:predicted amidohydrolase